MLLWFINWSVAQQHSVDMVVPYITATTSARRGSRDLGIFLSVREVNQSNKYLQHTDQTWSFKQTFTCYLYRLNNIVSKDFTVVSWPSLTFDRIICEHSLPIDLIASVENRKKSALVHPNAYNLSHTLLHHGISDHFLGAMKDHCVQYVARADMIE